MPMLEQLGLLLMAAEGVFDAVPLDQIASVSAGIRRRIHEREDELSEAIETGGGLSPAQREHLLEIGRVVVAETADVSGADADADTMAGPGTPAEPPP